MRKQVEHKTIKGKECKLCGDCNQWRSLDNYQKNKARKDGLSRICKECKSEKDKSYYSRNSEECKKRVKRWKKQNLERVQEYNDLWNKNNKEACSKHRRKYYKANAESVKNYSKNWRQENSKKRSETDRNWKKGNKDKVMDYVRRRRALKLGVEESYTVEDERFTRGLFDNQCVNCGIKKNLQIDHFYPLSRGNALTRQNAVLLCRSCNSSKGSKDPREFFNERLFNFIKSKLEDTDLQEIN